MYVEKKMYLQPHCLNFFWNSPIIISFVTAIIQVLTNKFKSKFKAEN